MADENASIKISAEVTDAVAGLQQVADKAKSLQQTMDSMKEFRVVRPQDEQALTALPEKLRSVTQTFTNMKEETKQLNEMVDQTAGGLGNLGSVAQNALGFALGQLGVQSVAAVAEKVIQLGEEAVSAAEKMQQISTNAKVIFGSDFPKMQAAADAMGASLGRNKSDLLGMETGFATLLHQVGFTTESTQKYSQELTQLSVNLAKGSKDGMTAEDAYRRVDSAIRGNIRALGDLNIDMKTKALQDFADSQGHGLKISQMTEEQQMMLRTDFLLKQVTQSQITGMESTGGLRDSTQRLGADWQAMLQVIGTDISPMINALVQTADFGLKHIQDLIAVIPGIGAMELIAKGFHAASDAAQKSGPLIHSATADILALGESYKSAGSDAGKWADESGKAGKKAADAAQKLRDEMDPLGQTYDRVSDEIVLKLTELENAHEQKMNAFADQLDSVKQKVIDLGTTYKQEIDRINDTKLDKVAGEMKKVADLKNKLDDDATKGGITADKFVTVRENRRDKDRDTLSAFDKKQFGLSDADAKQFDDMLSYDKQKGELDAYLKAHPEDKAGAQKLEGESTFTKDMAKLDEETKAKDAAFKDKMGKLDEEQKNIEDKKATEDTAYESAKQQYKSTQDAMHTFHDAYIADLKDMNKVTAEQVKELKSSLEDLKSSLANVKPDATAQSLANKAKDDASAAADTATAISKPDPLAAYMHIGAVDESSDPSVLAGRKAQADALAGRGSARQNIQVHFHGDVSMNDQSQIDAVASVLARRVRLEANRSN